MPWRCAVARAGHLLLTAAFLLAGTAVCASSAQASAWLQAGTVPQGIEVAREFSARVVWRTGGRPKYALLFVKGDRYRVEHRGGVQTELGLAGVTIVRQDQGEVWHVVSQRRQYVAVPLRPGHLLPFEVKLEGEIRRTLIGDATAGGRPAELFEVVVERYGRRESFFEWVDAEREFLLKLLSKHRDWSVEYEHVVFSKQPEFYFEVPRGYQRVESKAEEPEEEAR